MKLDWKNAPEWAKFLAMDENHGWYWYENEPELRNSLWRATHGKCIPVGFFTVVDHRKTLEQRPEAGK